VGEEGRETRTAILDRSYNILAIQERTRNYFKQWYRAEKLLERGCVLCFRVSALFCTESESQPSDLIHDGLLEL